MEKGHVRENFPFKLIGPLGQEMDQPPCFGNISSFLLLSAPWGWRQWAGGPRGRPADQELPRCILSLAEKEENGNCIKIPLNVKLHEFDWSVIQKSMYLPCLYNLTCMQRRWTGTMLFSWRGSTYMQGNMQGYMQGNMQGYVPGWPLNTDSQSFLISVKSFIWSKFLQISQKLVLISQKLFWSVKKWVLISPAGDGGSSGMAYLSGMCSSQVTNTNINTNTNTKKK